jgi:succinate dehydrogenase / fumarate reductase cytochrome b subunit
MSSNNRPLSPHLQIYNPQITSVLSIVHRATGVFLALGSLLMLWVLLSLSMGPEAFAVTQACLQSVAGQIVIFVFSLCLMYHLFNGVRHLFWDAGKGYALNNVYRSGYTVIAATILSTALIWWFGTGGMA